MTCLAALKAMDIGRRALFRVNKAALQQGRQLPPDILRTIATQTARAAFRGGLIDFTTLAMYSDTWLARVGARGVRHPFLHVDAGAGLISVHLDGINN